MKRRDGLRTVGGKVNRDQLCKSLWHRLDALRHDEAQRARVLARFRDVSAELEQVCAEHGLGPDGLEKPTRQVYCWSRFRSIWGPKVSPKIPEHRAPETPKTLWSPGCRCNLTLEPS